MTDLRSTISWLLLVLLAAVGGGAAVLGATQAPKDAPLKVAVTNTLAAPNYSEVVTETTPQGKQTDYLVYQAPDRLGGYVESGGKRTYIYIIGNLEYQSLTVAPGASTSHLVFYRQASQGVQGSDFVHVYLSYALTAPRIQSDGATHTFTLTQNGQTGNFKYQVSGQYVAEFNLTVSSASVQMVISQVGTSPPVALPKGAKVISVPARSSPSPSTSSGSSG
jgi:FlaG/FlaF family flagellin (archaellin)